jgi:hypothetical protein
MKAKCYFSGKWLHLNKLIIFVIVEEEKKKGGGGGGGGCVAKSVHIHIWHLFKASKCKIFNCSFWECENYVLYISSIN